MYIENLHIAQFGSLRDAQADGLQHRLCVLGCSQDCDRDSARDFVRWMLFGNEATINIHELSYDSVPRQRSAAGMSRGSLSITSHGRHRQIQRASDDAYGRLTIDGRYDDSTHEFRSLFGRITPTEFDTIFAPLLSRDLHPDELLSSGRLADLDVAAHRIPNQRLRQLQERHRYLRDELDRLPVRETVDQLTQRRNYLLHRIDELNQQLENRRRELDQQYHETCQLNSEVRRDVDRLDSEYRQRAEEANRRRGEVEEAWRVAQQAKDAYLLERREELTDLENRTNRWRGTLNEVRTRLAEVQQVRRSLPTSETHDESNCLVAGLAQKLDRLRRDVDAWTDYPVSAYPVSAYPASSHARSDPHTRPAGQTALSTTLAGHLPILAELRREVSRLCHTLQSHRGSKKDRWLENEADFLHQCDTLMSQWLAKLDEQQNVTQRQVSEVERFGLTLIDGSFEPTTDEAGEYDPARYYRTATYDVRSNYFGGDYTSSFDTSGISSDRASSQMYTSHHSDPYVAGYIDWDGTYVRDYPVSGYDGSSTNLARSGAPVRTSSPIHHGHVQAVPHSCVGYDVVHPDVDQRFRELIEWRNGIQRDLEARQRELESLELRRDSIDERRRQIDDHEIQAVRRELTELEERFRAADQRAQVEREIAQVVDQMSREREELRPCAVIEQASLILSQLTGGRFNRVRIENRHHVAVDDARGIGVNLSHCGRELRADTYLALCLAMVAEYRRRGIELPVLLSEPFVLANHGHDATRARVLAEFAAAGHQVIVLSCRQNTRELFHASDHIFVELQPRPTVRPIVPPLPRVTEPPLVAEPPTSPPSQPELEDQVRFKRRAASVEPRAHARHEPELDGRSSSQERRDARPTAAERRAIRSDANLVAPIPDLGNAPKSTSATQKTSPVSFSEQQHSLSLNSPIESTRVIDAQVATWLQKNGVQSVREFLEFVSADVIQQMTNDGLDAFPVRRWQDELALRCWVVGLAAEDAAMLITCGISDAEQLAEMDSDELYDFLVRKLKTQSDSTYDVGRFDSLRDQVNFWVRAARRSRTDWIRFRTRSFGKRAWSRGADESRTTRSRGSASSSGSNSASRSATRASRDSQSSSRSSRSSESRTATATNSRESGAKLRFHLSSSDPLVDAPSIGSRTAEHFHKIGVNNVAEFIMLNPESAASQIDNRRITAKTIGQWQAQAVLACRIPELRGHDAQILVACDIKDPTTLARMDPSELWARVEPFVKSAEGKRIIRGGKGPDLQEVEDWISWARQSRTMRAA